jgi:hypothetical protein
MVWLGADPGGKAPKTVADQFVNALSKVRYQPQQMTGVIFP